MPWLTNRERRTLTCLGVLALAGLGVLLWQRQRPALTLKGSAPPPQAAQWDQALAQARQIDVNTAGVAEFERLPGVGATLARRIVDDREAHGPFQSAEDLTRVKGIGPKTLSTFQEYVTTNE